MSISSRRNGQLQNLVFRRDGRAVRGIFLFFKHLHNHPKEGASSRRNAHLRLPERDSKITKSSISLRRIARLRFFSFSRKPRRRQFSMRGELFFCNIRNSVANVVFWRMSVSSRRNGGVRKRGRVSSRRNARSSSR